MYPIYYDVLGLIEESEMGSVLNISREYKQ